MPDVSVILCVYNAERYVAAAVESILTQTGCDFELIIVDDASTDQSRQVVDQAVARNTRVQRLNLPVNGGLARARNAGIAIARAPLLANMDADDIARPGRLAAQSHHMNEHPELDFLGSAAYSVDANGKCLVDTPTSPPMQADLVSWLFLFDNVMANPTMMMRTPVARAHPYSADPFFKYCEDYELWCRLSPHHSFSNLAEPLLDYRNHNDQITRRNRTEQKASAVVCALNYAERLLGAPVSAADFNYLHLLAGPQPPLSADDFGRVADLLTRLLAALIAARLMAPIEAHKAILNDFLSRMQKLASHVNGADVSTLLTRHLANASGVIRQKIFGH